MISLPPRVPTPPSERCAIFSWTKILWQETDDESSVSVVAALQGTCRVRGWLPSTTKRRRVPGSWLGFLGIVDRCGHEENLLIVHLMQLGLAMISP